MIMNLQNIAQNMTKNSPINSKIYIKDGTYYYTGDIKMTKKLLVTFPDKTGKIIRETAERMGLTMAEFCRLGTIEYLRSMKVFEKGGEK